MKKTGPAPLDSIQAGSSGAGPKKERTGRTTLPRAAAYHPLA